MNSKIKKVIFIIILLILFILILKNKEKMVVSIQYVGGNLYDDTANGSDAEYLKDNVFLNILRFDIDSAGLSPSGDETPILGSALSNIPNPPKIVFESYETCPTLYALYHGLRKMDDSKQENSNGIMFRNKCESVFYNSDKFVRIEHNIIDLRSKNTDTLTPSETPTSDASDNRYRYKSQNFKLYADTEGTNNIEYLDIEEVDSENPTDIFHNFSQGAKKTNFGVKSNFEIDDILKFIDFSYTCLCYAMIHIDYLPLTGNHYRVYPCPNHGSSKKAYFILPERIRRQVQEEGKEYTRAKCNSCALNIIVSLGKFPKKFKYLFRKF